MARSDDKFAWLKTHSVNSLIDGWIRSGQPIEYDDLVAATDHKQTGDISMTSFLTGSAGAEKGLYVIFQYGFVLEDAQGRIAVFGRCADDKGFGTRNLEGLTIMVSGSRMMSPSEAVESIVMDKISLGNTRTLEHVQPMGFALNRQPRRDGVERAHYLFCVYKIRLDDIRLNGLVQDNPDRFHWWHDPADLRAEQLDGAIDRVVFQQCYANDQPQAVANDIGVMFHPDSMMVDANQQPLNVEPFATMESRSVFISHDAGAQLKAFLLRDVLQKRSQLRVYPFLDLHHLDRSTKDFWTRIESLIERSDVFLLLVTQGTARSKGVARELDYWAALPNRPELIVLQVDGDREDVPEAAKGINWIDYRGREYKWWHKELEGLVERLRRCQFRVETLNAKSPHVDD